MTKTLYDQAMELYQRQAYDALKTFKKAKKKSWSTLGINAEMEARINAPIKIEGTVTGRLSRSEPAMQELKPANTRGTAKSENQAKLMRWREAGRRRFMAVDLGSSIDYTPREIHAVKGQSSHGTIAIMAEVVTQEKLRADPRFPIYQMVERKKRYDAIFRGKPYLPIFS